MVGKESFDQKTIAFQHYRIKRRFFNLHEISLVACNSSYSKENCVSPNYAKNLTYLCECVNQCAFRGVLGFGIGVLLWEPVDTE